jgi:DNA polymerase
MTNAPHPSLARIIEEVQTLVKDAGGRRGVLRLSPETAEALERMGANPQTVPAASGDSPANAGPAPAAAEEPSAAPQTETPPVALPPEAREAALNELGEVVSVCRKCPLADTRTQTVFGVGHPQADVVFVGEAPGREEDLQGQPFVGRAGQLLTRIIEGGMKMTRDDVYICNVLKCRPPDNRDPKPDEVEACHGYLIQQLDIIRPKVIIALGRPASQTLLNTAEGVNKLRGRWHFYHGIPLRVTFHPAYLLRKEQDKAKCWEDIKRVLALLAGKETPQPESGGGG